VITTGESRREIKYESFDDVVQCELVATTESVLSENGES
jgi:hypothetical protein